MKKFISTLSLILLLLPVTTVPVQAGNTEYPHTILGTAHLADQLVINLRGKSLLTGRRLAVVPLVDLNDLQVSSDLGRVISEELASALHFRNFHLAEIRSDDQILMARQVGELYLARTGPERAVLSRQTDLESLADKYNIGAFVVGTYSVIPPRKAYWFESVSGPKGTVVLNIRLVDPLSGAILSVGSTTIELNSGTMIMAERRSTSITEPVQTIRQTRF